MNEVLTKTFGNKRTWSIALFIFGVGMFLAGAGAQMFSVQEYYSARMMALLMGLALMVLIGSFFAGRYTVYNENHI
jgi:hypothetical protein